MIEGYPDYEADSTEVDQPLNLRNTPSFPLLKDEKSLVREEEEEKMKYNSRSRG